MQVVAANNNSPIFSSFSKKTGWKSHSLAAWKIDGEKAEPILYPALQKGNTLFIEEGMNKHTNAFTGEIFQNKEIAEKMVLK